MYLVNHLVENRGTSCKCCQTRFTHIYEHKYMNIKFILFTFDTSNYMFRNGILKENTLCHWYFVSWKNLHKA